MEYNELLLTVLENSNQLSSEDVEYIYNEKVDAESVVGIGMIIATVGIIGAAIASMCKTAKAEKTIQNVEELRNIDEKIKSQKNELRLVMNSVKDLQSKYTEFHAKAAKLVDMYSPTRYVAIPYQVYDSFMDRWRTEYNWVVEHNPNYDPDRFEKWHQIQDELKRIAQEIDKDLSEANSLINKIDSYNTSLLDIARKYKKNGVSGADALLKACEKMEKEIEEFKNAIKGKSYQNTSKYESVDDLKLAIFESCYAGEITKDEQNELLSFLQ